MNAKEARANVENYNNKVIEEREKRVNRFLETTVNAKIEENSRDGYNTCKVTSFVDKKDTELAIQKIKELGFDVEQFDQWIMIEW
jgi:hypothetical protein